MTICVPSPCFLVQLLAARVGLFVVMVCAIIFHLSRREFSGFGLNLVLLLLALFIVIGRWGLAPL